MKAYHTVLFFTKNQMGKLSLVPGFVEAYNGLDQSYSNLSRLADKQFSFDKAQAKEKKAKRRVMTDLTLEVSHRMMSFAVSGKDEDLLVRAKMTKRELTLSTGYHVWVLADRIYDLAVANMECLAGIGVTQALMDKHKSAITDYYDFMDAPRMKRVEFKGITAEIAETLKDMAVQMKDMDMLLLFLSMADTVLWDMYHSSRRVINTGLRHLDMKGCVMDAETGDGLAGAILKFFAIDAETGEMLDGKKQPALKKVSGKKGGFLSRILAPGTYRLEVYKVGYARKVMIVRVKKGERCEVNVLMC